MIYITGDKHTDFRNVSFLCRINETTLDDILIVLGDAGINYFANEKDNLLKDSLKNYPITFFCIHGNHEERPENIKTYKTKQFHQGIVYYEEKYPNLLFAKDGEIYDFNHQKALVIGGAYSVDKYYRRMHGYPWYESEQPDETTKENILKLVDKVQEVDIVLTHTCPYKYLPTEMFIQGIDQSLVDNSTEEFLDIIEEKLTYKTWYCGHFHTDKTIDKIRFMFHDIEEFK